MRLRTSWYDPVQRESSRSGTKPVASGAGRNPSANARDEARAHHRWIRFGEAEVEAGPTNRADAQVWSAETAPSPIWRPVAIAERDRETGSTWPCRTGAGRLCPSSQHGQSSALGCALHHGGAVLHGRRGDTVFAFNRMGGRVRHRHAHPLGCRPPTQPPSARERSRPRRAQRAWRDTGATWETSGEYSRTGTLTGQGKLSCSPIGPLAVKELRDSHHLTRVRKATNR